MILDATAGNRSIYQYKKSENIIFIDIEKQLWTKPDRQVEIAYGDFSLPWKCSQTAANCHSKIKHSTQ
jgi:hypothetical protein